jgi:hypothetical protein
VDIGALKVPRIQHLEDCARRPIGSLSFLFFFGSALFFSLCLRVCRPYASITCLSLAL